jgi:Predicted membrane protein (DUF2142)
VDRARGVNPLRIGLAAGIVLAALLATWAAAIGRYGGPDEPAHVLRAYAVAHGEVVGDEVAGLPSGYRAVVVPAALGTGDPACYRHDPALTSACSVAVGTGSVSVATAAGTASPIYYALVGIPVRALGVEERLIAYRLAAVALVVMALTTAIARLVTFGRAAIISLVGITPATWFLFGVVNPNALEIALLALAWVGVARRSIAYESAWWISVPLALAIVVRPIAALCALSVLIAVEFVGQPNWPTRIKLWCAPIVGVTWIGAWNRWVDLELTDPRTARSGSIAGALRSSIAGMPRTAAEAIASLSWRELWAPMLAVVAWLVMCVVAWSSTRPRIRRGDIAIGAVALIAAPVVFEVALYERIGPIWQGRYSLPVFIGIGTLIIVRGTRSPSPRAWVAFITTSALAEVITYWSTVRRYAVGTKGSWLLQDATGSAAWLNPRLWIAIHLLLVAAVMAAALNARTIQRFRKMG